MLLYVINVDSCIHVENYRIFFYEPAARKHLDLFSASWNLPSLMRTFGCVAEYINRRGFENRDYQVLVCVRRKESERWKESTLYAKAMVSQALEASGAMSVITGAFTRKVQVLFQVEQPYYGTVPRTSVWEEELSGLGSLMDILGVSEHRQFEQRDDDSGKNRMDCSGYGELVQGWDETLYEVLARDSERPMDEVTEGLKERLYRILEEENLMKKEEISEIDEELPEVERLDEDEICEDVCEYVSHRIRSLLDGSGLNRAAEVIYWPVPTESSRATRISMLSMVNLIRNGEEVTSERVRECMTESHPDYEKKLLYRYRKALWGYRQQLLEKKEMILQETAEKEVEELPEPISSASVPEISRTLSDRTEHARQQILNCAVSLRKSEREEIKERIDDITQTLTETFEGMESELTTYKNEVKGCLYREIADSSYIWFDDKKKTENWFGKQKVLPSADGNDEQAAKMQIYQWKQDMHFLIECTQWTGFVSTCICLFGTMAAAILPYLLYQGKVWTYKESRVSSFCIWSGLLVFMIGKRIFMNRYFVKSISESYAQLEKKLKDILEEYTKRAQRFQEAICQWIENEKESENRQLLTEKQDKAKQMAAMRAWHLANIQKILDSLDTFGPMEQGFLRTQKTPEMVRRILQPMDYFQKEQGNEIYWPVMETEERMEEADE